MPLLDAIGLSTLPLLAADLLHPTKTYSKQLRQLKLRTLARRMCCQDLPSQIIIVGSRHQYDAVLIVTDLTSCDYRRIVAESQIVVDDTRNAAKTSPPPTLSTVKRSC